MKLIIASHTLLQGLKVVEPVVSSNKLVPVCDNVQLKLGDSSILLISTNTHQSIIHSIDCECESKGRVLVPFADVYSLVKTLPSSPITMEFSDQGLEISCDTGTYNITCTDKVVDFPKIETVDKPVHSVEISSSLIDTIQSKTLKFVDPEISTMSGVGFDFKKGELHVVALQMRLLSLLNIPCNSPSSKLFYIQKKAIELMGAFSFKGEITMSFSQTKFQVQNESTILITNLQDENFQPYESVIVNNPYWIDVEKETLLRCVSRARNFSGVDLVGFVVSHKEVEIIADNHEKGKGFSEKYPLSDANIGEDDEIKFGLNVKYLIDTLSSFRAEVVRISLKDDKSFIVISDQDDKESFIQMAQYKYF
jgi:DNA polymerase III sliding clamp (beta) subunit (PCNA family)